MSLLALDLPCRGYDCPALPNGFRWEFKKPPAAAGGISWIGAAPHDRWILFNVNDELAAYVSDNFDGTFSLYLEGGRNTFRGTFANVEAAKCGMARALAKGWKK